MSFDVVVVVCLATSVAKRLKSAEIDVKTGRVKFIYKTDIALISQDAQSSSLLYTKWYVHPVKYIDIHR